MDERTVITVLVWIGLGLGTGLWMVRRGHDQRWVYLAVLLGPLFVPIAVERVRRRPTVVGDHPVPVRNGGLRVMVGYDGSPESRDAAAAAARLFGPFATTLVLAQVVSYDAAEDESYPDVEDARERLAEAVAELGAPQADFEVLTGPPAEALCSLAREQDMDLLVVGPRGRGLSQRLLGSVAERIVRDARVPVLVAHSPGLPSSETPGIAV